MVTVFVFVFLVGSGWPSTLFVPPPVRLLTKKITPPRTSKIIGTIIAMAGTFGFANFLELAGVSCGPILGVTGGGGPKVAAGTGAETTGGLLPVAVGGAGGLIGPGWGN